MVLPVFPDVQALPELRAITEQLRPVVPPPFLLARR
jgi:hypothetical protein